jgi:hypothetical protein
MADTMITWTPDKLERFRVAYARANVERKNVFRFDDHWFVRDYAKYLIQFLDGQFSGQPQ